MEFENLWKLTFLMAKNNTYLKNQSLSQPT